MSNLSKLLNTSINQNNQLDMVIAKAKSAIASVNSMVDDGDRAWFCYTDKFDFDERDNKVQDLNFNISGDADYVAQRLIFALKLRRTINPDPLATNDPSGMYRPAYFNYDSSISPTTGLKVDFHFELTESWVVDGKSQTRKYQNQPIPGILSFSHNNPFYGSPSGMHFPIDWPLIRNSVIQCKVTIISAINEINQSIQTDKYRFIGILEGYKRVRGIR